MSLGCNWVKEISIFSASWAFDVGISVFWPGDPLPLGVVDRSWGISNHPGRRPICVGCWPFLTINYWEDIGEELFSSQMFQWSEDEWLCFTKNMRPCSIYWNLGWRVLYRSEFSSGYDAIISTMYVYVLSDIAFQTRLEQEVCPSHLPSSNPHSYYSQYLSIRERTLNSVVL